jgi:hypothetical protein
MSLNVDIDLVEAVLLNDGWHKVFHRTFDIGSFEFTRVAEASGGDVALMHHGGVGFGFSEEDSNGRLRRFAGPISSLVAVRYTRDTD